jgi:anti-sigma regulatory factor (Ser/Thr protein kinase)
VSAGPSWFSIGCAWVTGQADMSLLAADQPGTTIRLGDHYRPSVRESYPAILSSVPLARRDVAEFAAAAGASQEQLEVIRLATSEALANAAQHAYPARPGHIHVTARMAGGELWVLIADSGCGIHAGRESDGLGLGLAMIAKLTDGFSVVERSSGGTELRLRFVLDASKSGS